VFVLKERWERRNIQQVILNIHIYVTIFLKYFGTLIRTKLFPVTTVKFFKIFFL